MRASARRTRSMSVAVGLISCGRCVRFMVTLSELLGFEPALGAIVQPHRSEYEEQHGGKNRYDPEGCRRSLHEHGVEGISGEQLERVFSPSGLDLGGVENSAHLGQHEIDRETTSEANEAHEKGPTPRKALGGGS